MAKFPRREADIAALTRAVVTGLQSDVGSFPAPPFPPVELERMLHEFHQKMLDAHAADVAAKDAHAAKDKVQAALVNGLKTDLRYAEAVARLQPLKLKGLGWGPPRPRHGLEPPGQVLGITITSEGRDSIGLAWRAPFDGGEVAAYQIQRREPGGDWKDVATSTHLEHLLENQPRGVDLEFRIHAINRAGGGAASGVVSAVL